jgi:hypothetical protein
MNEECKPTLCYDYHDQTTYCLCIEKQIFWRHIVFELGVLGLQTRIKDSIQLLIYIK